MTEQAKSKLDEVKDLIELMKQEGITKMKVGDVELEMPYNTPSTPIKAETENKSANNQDVNEIEEDEELLFWSVNN